MSDDNIIDWPARIMRHTSRAVPNGEWAALNAAASFIRCLAAAEAVQSAARDEVLLIFTGQDGKKLALNPCDIVDMAGRLDAARETPGG